MSSNACSCSCGCSPCACSSGGFGCVSDLCVPRPCFFQGQLVTADDLNAAVTYFRTRESMLARFIGGWGILGGLRVDKAPGIESTHLSSTPAAVSPNPQILAGTTVQVSAGAAIDAAGRALTLCSPRILDLAELMAEAPAAPSTKSCSTWFAPIQGICSDLAPTNLTATEYWLIAEYDETPSRPVPQYSGGGACDPAPTCDFSRRMEGVRFRLVTSLPTGYFAGGCLDPMPLRSETLASLPGGTIVGRDEVETPALATCLLDTYARFESWTQDVAEACCGQPAVVLARLLVTSSPGSLGQDLPSVPLYVFVLDGYPFRRVITSAAQLTLAAAQQSCRAGGSGGAGPAGQSAFSRTTAGFTQPEIEGTVTISVRSSDWLAAGLPIAIDGVGLYLVTAIPDSTHITIKNMGMTSVSPGSTVATDKLVVVTGVPGEHGSNGTNGTDGKNAFSYTTGPFNQPPAGVAATVPIADTSWMVSGQIVYLSTGGWYQVESVINPTSANLQNLGYPGNVLYTSSPPTAIAPGKLSPSGPIGPGTSLSGQRHLSAADAPEVGDFACDTALGATPRGEVMVFLNGKMLWTSYGDTVGDVYWMSSGGVMRNSAAELRAGDRLFVGEAMPSTITTTDFFDFVYLV